MEDVLNINGKSYYSKSMINKEVNKQIKSKLMATGNFTEKFVDDIVGLSLKVKTNTKKTSSGIQNSQFQFAENHRVPYLCDDVDWITGKIYSNKRVCSFTVDDLYYIKRHIFDGMTYKDVGEIKRSRDLNKDVVGRIIWNLQKGTFDNILQVYENRLYARKQVGIENNPQKRKENRYL